MKQTAVEWLINQVLDNMGDIPMDIQEQAKEMEKDQIVQACTDGIWLSIKSDLIVPSEISEKYYNGLYKSE